MIVSLSTVTLPHSCPLPPTWTVWSLQQVLVMGRNEPWTMSRARSYPWIFCFLQKHVNHRVTRVSDPVTEKNLGIPLCLRLHLEVLVAARSQGSMCPKLHSWVIKDCLPSSLHQWDTLRYAGICWGMLGYAGICWDTLGYTRIHCEHQLPPIQQMSCS